MKRLLTLAALILLSGFTLQAADKKIVMIAGKPSHGPGEHEHNAGLLLFKQCLTGFPGITIEEYSGGWPTNADALDGASAIVIYSDGGEAHPALQDDHLQQIAAARAKGAGIACLHYAVEPTKEKGEAEFLDWIGGCFEVNWSVNPVWPAGFKILPDHPITRGVTPFAINDEWYYHMRFVPGMKGVTPILTALPTADTLSRPDGEHSGNPDVRKAVADGESQTVAWAYESPDGKRGFGFTGGHYHKNWANDDMRKIVLNAILWVAKVEVPKDGVSSVVTPEDLEKNLDDKGGRRKVKPPTNTTVGK